MKFSNRSNYILMGLLVLLNIILRIPSYPHQTGYDSFHTSTLANIVTVFGCAKWWIHPLSIFGMYPHSYASTVPFALSGLSQLTGLEMETTVLVFDVFVGLFSIFTIYLLAGMIWDDDLFKFFVAFGCSTAQGMLVFTTWDISTRGLFIVMLPLFAYLLLRLRTNKLRAGMLAMVLFVLLAATHHYIYFTFPIIASFAIIVVTTKINKLKIFQRYREKRHIQNINCSSDSSNVCDYISPTVLKKPIVYLINNNLLNVCYLVVFFIMFSLPFFIFKQTFITAGSRYGWIIDMFIINTRYTGPLIFLAFGGVAYLVLKRDKQPEYWFLLLLFMFLIPFSYIQTYAHFILFTFLFLFIGVSLVNIAQAYSQKRTYVSFVIIASLLIAVSFSGFYQHWHTGMKEGRSDWRMTDETYVGGKWVKENINKDKIMESIGDVGGRMFAVSGGASPWVCGGASGVAYNFVNVSEFEIIALSPFSKEFYFDNPYVLPRGSSVGGTLNWFSELRDIEGPRAIMILSKYNISYIVSGRMRYPLLGSIDNKKSRIYDSGTTKIWSVRLEV